MRTRKCPQAYANPCGLPFHHNQKAITPRTPRPVGSNSLSVIFAMICRVSAGGNVYLIGRCQGGYRLQGYQQTCVSERPKHSIRFNR